MNSKLRFKQADYEDDVATCLCAELDADGNPCKTNLEKILFAIACRQERIAVALEQVVEELRGIRRSVGTLER